MTIEVNPDGLPILDQFSEEGFIDCVFAITQLREANGHYQFHMSAYFEDKVVGANVKVVKGIKAGFDTNMELIRDHVYREGIQFSRSGPESDVDFGDSSII